MFKSLLKAAVGVVTLPVDIVADIATLGGALTDQDEPYTTQKARSIVENIGDATESERPAND